MKKFILVFILLFGFVGSVFAEDWMLRGQYHNEVAGDYKVYWDAENETPWIDCAKQLSMLLTWYQKALNPDTEELLYNVYLKDEAEKENFWCLAAAKKGYFHTMEIYEGKGDGMYAVHHFVCENGTVIEIIIKGNRDE